jgi:hypothetical protein
MKKSILISVCLYSLLSFSQERNKFFINGGSSYYPYMLDNKKNFNISISYHRQMKIKKNCSMEYYYLYSQNDYFPSFYKDEKAMAQFIILGNPETIFDDTKWRNVQNYEIGSKLHYSFIKNKNLNVSCNIGLGIRMYNSTDFNLLSINRDNVNNSYVYSSLTIYGSGGYGVAMFPGMHMDYELDKSFLLAFDGGYHQDVAVHLKYNENNGTFWNFSIGIGKKF